VRINRDHDIAGGGFSSSACIAGMTPLPVATVDIWSGGQTNLQRSRPPTCLMRSDAWVCSPKRQDAGWHWLA
jgi:hypothetical protein